MIDTKELRRLAQAATPGPWKVGQYLGSPRQFVIHMDVGDKGRGSDVAFTSANFGNDETIANARLIAAANPAAISELLDRLEAAEKERDALRAELTGLRNSMTFRTSLIGRIEAEREDLHALIAAVKKQVNAEFRLRMKKEIECNALRAKIEQMEQQEPYSYIYEYANPIDGSPVWRDKPGYWNAQFPRSSKPLYALPVAQPAPILPEGCPPHAEIYVGDDMFVWCDWKDFDLVKKYNWNLTTRNRSGCLYAQSWDCHNTSERKRITMHGLIMPAPDGQFVDHINGNGLDNRRENLRLVTHQQNSFNQKHHGGSSKFKGVSIDRISGSWRAYITVDGKRKHLGRHGTELDAAKAYDMAAKEFFGEYAKLNLESAPSPTNLDET